MPEPIGSSDHSVPLPLPALVERVELKVSLDLAKRDLETLRGKEEGLRASLVQQLHTLTFESSRARHKVTTRQFNSADLDMTFDRMKDAEKALGACLEEIAYQELTVADMERDYNDRALWEAN